MIQFVGQRIGAASSGAGVTLSLTTLLNGIDNTARQGDYVLVYGGHSDATADAGVSTGGFLELADIVPAGQRFAVNRKIMTASPDLTVDCLGTGVGTESAVYGVLVFRGVDPVTPEDTTTTTTTGDSTSPDGPSITTVTPNAVVCSVMGIGIGGNTINSAAGPSGYLNAQALNAVDTDDYAAGGAWIRKAVAGAENPPSWASFSFTSDPWGAVTVALRALVSPVAFDIGMGALGGRAPLRMVGG